MTAGRLLAHAGDMPGADRSTRPDLWLAVAAGPGPWLQGQRLSPQDGMVLATGMASGLVLSLAVTATAVASLALTMWQTLLFGSVLVGSMLVLVSPKLPRPDRPGAGELVTTLLPLVAARCAAAMAVLALSVKAYGSVQPLALAGLGVPAGAQAAVTLRAIGVHPTWLQVVRGFVLSTAHAGMLTGVLILAWLPVNRSLQGVVVALGLTLYTVVAVAAGTFAVVSTLAKESERGDAERVADVRAEVHRDQAHWLHDEICAELSYLRLRLQAGPVDPDTLRRCLDDLDHRLRVRQVDEILEGGPARLGEIIQPFLRAAQNNGLHLADVPTFEIGAALLEPEVGRQVQRALAVLTANAIQAGAREMAMRASIDGKDLVIEIEDDAGGFELTAAVAGRGLDGLRRDLGPQRLDLMRTERGTRAQVRIATVRPVAPV